MNKLLKAFGKICKNIYRFIDKLIVTPISKAVYQISKNFNKRTGGLDKLLNRPNFLLYLSLIIAVVVFLLVDSKAITLVENEAEVITNVPLTVKYNEEAYVVDGIPEKVDVILTGRSSDLYLAKQIGEHEVVLDLTDYPVSDTPQEVNLTYTKAIDSLTYTIDPSYVRVTIKEKESSFADVTYDLLNVNKLDKKLSVKSVEISESEVVVKGSKDAIENISSVKALIDLSDSKFKEAGTHTIDNVLLVAYDGTGKVLDKVSVVPNTISATVTLDSYSTNVPLTILTTGKLVTGKAIASILINNNASMSLDIYGDQEELSKITSVPVTLNVEGQGASGTKTYNVSINKPTGVRHMSATTATISFTFGDEKQKTVEIANVKYRNLADGLSANALSDAKINVQVIGVQSVIDAITEKDISAYVDLAGYGAGDYEVDVFIDNTDPRLNFIVSNKIGIKLTEE
ncbi:MAG: hypothetical protein IJA94_02755 [Bacilli bacterium]|nr:hypothetical protein [Bacilli bacterium]